MMKRGFNDIAILGKALDTAWLRNQVISNNIANVDTPNYKTYTVKFEDLLKDAIESKGIKGYRTNERHFAIGIEQPEAVVPRIDRIVNTSSREDGNNVDIDIEMANLAKNNITYQALVEQLSNKISRIKNAINGSGR